MKGRIWNLWPAAVAGLALAAMVLYTVPGQADLGTLEALPAVSAAMVTPATQDAVNINTADMETLMTLPGIGEVRARAIIEYRESEGPFRYPEELVYVPGIGEGTLEGLLPLITTGGV